jgi:adhesin transport system outer membrane protein
MKNKNNRAQVIGFKEQKIVITNKKSSTKISNTKASNTMRFKVNHLRFFVAMGILIVTPKNYAMDLQDYVADVVSGHPLVREQVHIFRQARQEQTIASSGWRPSVDLQASASRVEGDSPVVGGTRLSDYNASNVELSVTQNLFDGFDTTYRVKQTEARMQSALFELYDTADNIALDAVQAYLDVLKQKRLLELAVENVNSHEETLKKIRQRSRSGVGRRSQLEQTEGRIARAQASWVAQQNNVEDALSAAHELLGRYINPQQLLEPLAPPSTTQNLDDLIDEALVKHPALRVASYNIDAALLDQQRSKNTRYPNLDLKLAKEVGDNISGIPGDRDELSLVLNLKYNLYNGGADRATEHKKTSAVHEHQQFKARVRRQVINTLRLAWAADQSLNEQLEYLKQHVKKTRETSVSYQKEFFIGQRDLINLLDVKSELNSAQNRYVEAYFEALAARFRVHEGLGDLFDAIGVRASVGDDDLIIAKVEAKALDGLPLNLDIDADNKVDNSDHCDNSVADSPVKKRGCLTKFDVSTLANIASRNNNDPRAFDDELTLEENGVLVIAPETLMKNDKDADNDTLGLKTFTQPAHGKLALNLDKHLVYRAAEGFVGTDTFTYTITDNNQGNATATVSLSVVEDVELSLDKVHYVNFVYDSVELTPESKERFSNIVRQLDKQSDVTLRVYAYTDNIGSKRFNRRLSNARAKAINGLLQASGIAASRIKVYGKGEENPIAENDTAEGRAINRRGEFHFSSVQYDGGSNNQSSNSDNYGAFNDYFTLEANGVLVITPKTLFENDNDKEELRLQAFTQPEHGQLAMNTDSHFVYRSPEGFIGTDMFTYTTVDNNQNSVTATVSVDVMKENVVALDKIHYVNFAYDSTGLTPESMAKVEHIVSQLESQPEVTVRIYTYTDNIGSKQFNRKLSRSRAEVMSRLLQERGIAESRIEAYGKGEENPMANNDSEEGRAINRRGEFHFRGIANR